MHKLVLPSNIVPGPCDHEVKEFRLIGKQEIRELKQRQFKLNIAMTCMDYMIRHGLVHSKIEKLYNEIRRRLQVV